MEVWWILYVRTANLYSQSVVEPGANAAAGGVAEMVIVWRSAERYAPCSGRLVGWLEFIVPFHHKYGYVEDEVQVV